MDQVLVVCGAGASSTFLVHAMRREISQRALRMTVDATTLDGLERRAQNVQLVLVAHHLEAAADGVRLGLPATVRVAVLPAISPTGDGPARAVDMAVDLLQRPTTDQIFRSTPSSTAPLEVTMTERVVTIASKNGLHARPASLFTQAAAKSGLAVQISKAGKSVNAASILGVISLGIDFDDTVTLSAEGDQADVVLTELAALLAVDHDAA